jgi:hypothetical protein
MTADHDWIGRWMKDDAATAAAIKYLKITDENHDFDGIPMPNFTSKQNLGIAIETIWAASEIAIGEQNDQMTLMARDHDGQVTTWYIHLRLIEKD